MAFNTATDKIKQNVQDSQNIQAKKIQNQTDQESLDLNKQLDQAKVKQARNEGMLSDYVGDQLEKHLNDQYKAKSDQLDAVSGLQDIAQHKAQQGAAQATQIATQLHDNDPDVQSHVNTLVGIMKANNGALPPSAASTVLPNLTAGNEGASPAAPSAISGGPGPDGAQIPSIFPMTGQSQSPLKTPQQIPEITPGVAPVQGGASPQNVDSQVTPQVGAPTAQAPAPTPQAQPSQGQQGVDLSPVEQAFGMPKGSMWLNPGTMKPEISPIWKESMEAHQRAQANYDVNQPFRETQRQDKLEQQATQLLTKQLSSRAGGIGLQDNKVNAAIHARQLIDQAYNPQTGQYDVTQVPYGELAESVGSLLSGNSGSSEGRINSLKQRTAQGDLNGAISYFTGKPSNATSQDAIKQLVGIIDRQGSVSEDLRDKYLEGIKKLPVFQQLEPDRAQSLYNSNIGNSFKDYLKNSPDKQVASQFQPNDAFIQKAKDAGYSEADIQNYLKGKR